MKKKIAERWVRALRNSDYKQASGSLRDYDEYCCLGVLCDLHSMKTGWEWEKNRYLGETEVLPPEVVKWSGITSSDGTLNNNKTLARLNDEGKSFSEIADIIEQNWKKL